MIKSILLAWVLGGLLAASDSLAHDKTIFGSNKRAIRKAMKEMSRALGVRCKHCHVGKDYHRETPNKDLARLMKHDFVDSLIHKGTVELTLEYPGQAPGDTTKKQLFATYQKADDGTALIHLKAVVGEDQKTFDQQLSLPQARQKLNCGTCHAGKLQFLTNAP